MDIIKLEIPEVLLINPKVYTDNRGWFFESYSKRYLEVLGVDFVQDNHSFSKEKNTLRGLHFQNNPMAQAKLIRCTRGAILDVAVDLRKGSPYYLKWLSVELSAENKNEIFIPRGFAHGFLTLTENVELMYKADNFYSSQHDRSLAWNDVEIGIDWNTTSPILSDKDKSAVSLEQSDANFIYESH